VSSKLAILTFRGTIVTVAVSIIEVESQDADANRKAVGEWGSVQGKKETRST